MTDAAESQTMLFHESESVSGSWASTSIDKVYRYTLGRTLKAGSGRVLFVMLNPSTADALRDDPTIRKCKGFAERWGVREIEVGNLFAYRSTDPSALTTVLDPVGPDNDGALRFMLERADTIVVAWGRSCPRALVARSTAVLALLMASGKPVHCLGTTEGGQPRHPLMLSYDTPLVLFTPSPTAGAAGRDARAAGGSTGVDPSPMPVARERRGEDA